MGNRLFLTLYFDISHHFSLPLWLTVISMAAVLQALIIIVAFQNYYFIS